MKKILIASLLCLSFVGGTVSAYAALQRKATKTYAKKKSGTASALTTVTPKSLGAKFENHKFYNTIGSLNVLTAEITWAKGIAGQVIKAFDTKYPAKKAKLTDLEKLEEYRGMLFVSYWANRAGTTVEMRHCSSMEWCYAKMTTYCIYSKLVDKAADETQKSAIYSAILTGEAMNSNNGTLISTLGGFGAAGGSLQPILEIDGMTGAEQEWHKLLENILGVMNGKRVHASTSMQQALQMLDAEVRDQCAAVKEYADCTPMITEEMIPNVNAAMSKEKTLIDAWGAAVDKIFTGNADRATQAANATIAYVESIASLANSMIGDV
ncbi:MAG: hypothetical protein J6C81_00660 [Muribaculaceae bacterium]|nr:hypothetical protein [Muribaculaceae bacterium]